MFLRMATAAEVQTQLDQINAAISALLGGGGVASVPTAEFWEGGDRWRGVPIESLFAERARLEKRLAGLQGSSASIRVVEVLGQ